MQSTISMTSMCQGSRLLGMSRSDEHCLESYLRKLVVNNGNEFVIDKLKTLKQHTIRKIEDPTSVLPKKFDKGSSSIAWSRSKDQPRGPLSVIYRTWKTPSARLRGIGMLINTFFEEDITPKQLKKFLDGINTDGHFCDNQRLPITPQEALTFVNVNQNTLDHMDMISGLDITGSELPFGESEYNIKAARKGLTSKSDSIRHKAIADMSYAFDQQWTSAPKQVTDYIKDQFNCFKGVKTVAATGSRSDKQVDYMFTNKQQLAGTMSALQKPGGKLRSVFNTNRVINYALTPYANGLEHAFYDAHPSHITVKQQDKGMQSVQQMVRRRKTLVSADLTSATDRLNFRVFTNGLRSSVLKLLFSDAQLSKFMNTDYWFKRDSSDQCISLIEQLPTVLQTVPALEPDTSRLSAFRAKNRSDSERVREVINGIKSINLFEDTAQRPFFSSDLHSTLALKTGQPLGMMGSFHTLTCMNFCLGRAAEMASNGHFSEEIPQFVCVGDDFVGDASIMDEYSELVTASNGLDNHEKALHSNKSAEFLSHLITPSRIISMKPKFQRGKYAVLLNSEKTTVNKTVHAYRLDDKTRADLEILASIGDPVQSEMTTPATSSRFSAEKRNLIQATLKAISLEGSGSPDPISVSDEQVYLAREEKAIEEAKKQVSSIPEIAQFIKSLPRFVDNETVSDRAIIHHENDEYSPEVTKYNHHTARRERVVPLKEQDKVLRKKAEVARKIDDFLEKGKDSKIQLPHHAVKRNLSSFVLNGQQAVDDSDMISRAPFPRVGRHNDQSNEIDRGKQYAEHMSTKYDETPYESLDTHRQQILVNAITVKQFYIVQQFIDHDGEDDEAAINYCSKIQELYPDYYAKVVNEIYKDDFVKHPAMVNKTLDECIRDKVYLSSDPLLLHVFNAEASHMANDSMLTNEDRNMDKGHQSSPQKTSPDDPDLA